MDKPLKTLGRVYFIALLPFILTALAPWVLGPKAATNMQIFVIWSFTVLVFQAAAFWGFAIAQQRWIYLQGLVSCLICAGGVLALTLSVIREASFSAVAILAFSHWCAFIWQKRLFAVTGDFFKQHNRFVWTGLACHMFVLFNLIYLAQKAL